LFQDPARRTKCYAGGSEETLALVDGVGGRRELAASAGCCAGLRRFGAGAAGVRRVRRVRRTASEL